MNEDHEPGKCYACKQYKPVRWKNLYTIGSEGTNLCIECETITVKFVRHLADKAQQSKAAAIKERKKGKVKKERKKGKVKKERKEKCKMYAMKQLTGWVKTCPKCGGRLEN